MAKLMNWVGPVVPVSPSPVARTTGAALAVGERDWLLAWILMPFYSSFSLIFHRGIVVRCTLEVMTESFTVFAGEMFLAKTKQFYLSLQAFNDPPSTESQTADCAGVPST